MSAYAEQSIDDKKKSFHKFINSSKPSVDSSIQMSEPPADNTPIDAQNKIDNSKEITEKLINLQIEQSRNANTPKQNEENNAPIEIVNPTVNKPISSPKEAAPKKTKKKENNKLSPEEKKQLEKEHTPAIDKRSKILSKKLNQERGSSDVWKALHDLSKEKMNKFAQMAFEQNELKNEKIQEECTFEPIIYTGKKESRKEKEDIYMRSLQWKQQKTEKNNQLKQQLSDKEKYMCTFNPQTFTKEKSVCDTGLVFVKDSEKYRNRVKEAELERDFKQECLNKYSGKNWKRQITIPKESKLVNPAASYVIM